MITTSTAAKPKAQRVAILYARVPTRPDEAESQGLQAQRDTLAAACALYQWEIAAAYEDPESSGKTINSRSGLQAAIQHACRTKGLICVYSLSRLARNTPDAIKIIEQIHAGGVDMYLHAERIDTTTPFGMCFFAMTAAFAQLESEQISALTSRAMKHHQVQGRRMSRAERCPYGQMPDPLDPLRLIACPAEQNTIQAIHQAREQGMSLRDICRWLDDQGKARRGGRPWSEGGAALVGTILRKTVPIE